MEPFADIDDIERRLALAYAPADRREALAVLWRVDQRLEGIVRRANEPMIGAIRLAWWREALERLDQGGPPSEPLLQAVAAALPPRGVQGGAVAELEHGWSLLIEPAPDRETLDRYAAQRGAQLFALSAMLLGAPLPAGGEAAGEMWALTNLPHGRADPAQLDGAIAARRGALPRAWPLPLRALGMLAMLAQRDAGRGMARREPRGAPARVARALWHRLSGR